MKVAIYCRVSTMEQVNEGYSIDEQEKKLKSFCEINNWNKYEVFVDAGVSGSTTNRPALRDLMNRLNQFSLVLVYKLDRLTRNVRDLLDMLDTFEKNNVSFRSATEVYDTSSAMGRLFVTLVGAMAEWERSTISERTEMGKLSAANQGVHVSKVPFYYDKIDGKLYPNDKAEIVRYMVKRVLEGASTLMIADELNASKYKNPSGTKWLPISIRRTLKNPHARGHSVFKDIFLHNTHEPIISEDEYKVIIDKLKERTHHNVNKHPSIFRGKLKCHICGNHLTLMVNKKHTKTQGVKLYKRYYCDYCKTNKTPKEQKITFRAEEAEKAFINYIKHVDFAEYYKEDIKEEANIIDIDRVNRQRQKYQEAWSDGYMTDSEFHARMDDTKKLIDQYYSNLKEQSNTSYIDISEMNESKEIILSAWDDLDDIEKEYMIDSVFKEIEYEFIKSNTRLEPSTIKVKRLHFY